MPAPVHSPPALPDAQAPGPGRIVVRGLTRRFDGHVALHPLDLDLGPGITGLLGPNGSGKSTFLRLLTGLVRPDAGSVSVDGVPLRGDGTRIRRRVTYAPGELHLYGELRAHEQLHWLLRGRGRRARRRALDLAGDLDLPLQDRVRTYSHGMKRQLLFVAALAPDVRVRILDEPTEGLDPTRRGRVLELLEEDAARGTTVLLSSHHLGEVDRSCDRLLFLQGGRLVADETSTSVADRAARLVRIAWPEGIAPERLVAAVSAGPEEVVRCEGTHLAVLLEDPDPRPFLARLATLADLPAPISVEHGRLSLQELYRELYGVEGL